MSTVIELKLDVLEGTAADAEEALARMRQLEDDRRWDTSDETAERILAWLREGEGRP